ncbi:hypothetical protein ACOI1C_04120 [Bacillus sp. DJP31]|uniref:hypothetical protein n=1 Tax=Bacillus sp. DJP31 TaxID=3409789 RepID=UPI003BB4F134
MPINESTVQLRQGTNISNFESSVNQIEGVQRSMVDIENMNAVIQYDSSILEKERLETEIKKFM